MFVSQNFQLHHPSTPKRPCQDITNQEHNMKYSSYQTRENDLNTQATDTDPN